MGSIGKLFLIIFQHPLVYHHVHPNDGSVLSTVLSTNELQRGPGESRESIHVSSTYSRPYFSECDKSFAAIFIGQSRKNKSKYR